MVLGEVGAGLVYRPRDQPPVELHFHDVDDRNRKEPFDFDPEITSQLRAMMARFSQQ